MNRNDWNVLGVVFALVLVLVSILLSVTVGGVFIKVMWLLLAGTLTYLIFVKGDDSLKGN